MKSLYLNLRDRFLSIGVHEGLSSAKRSTLRTYNAILLFTLIALLSTLITNLVTLSWTTYDYIAYLGSFGVIACSLILNYKRHYYASRFCYVILFTLMLFALTIVSGNIFFAGLFSLILVSITIGFFISSRDTILITLFILAVNIISIFIVNNIDYNFDPNAYMPVERVIVLIVTFIVFYLCLNHYKNITRVYFNKNRELIQELGDRNREIKASNENLEQFSYLIAHDIKAPLKTMNSFVGLIERDIREGRFESLSEYSDFVSSSGNRLLKMVDEVLFFSRISNDKKIESHELDTNEIVEQISNELKNNENNYSITFDSLHPIQGNKTKVTLLFQNLIHNGLKYNQNPNPTVHVSSKNEADATIFEIEDNGIGIDDEDKDEIFTLFKRLHSESEFEGTGVGLASCKKIVTNHLKGTITVHDNIPNGSIFSIRVPKIA